MKSAERRWSAVCSSLAPGEATHWHRDSYDRVSVILYGEQLTIGFREGSPSHVVQVGPGQVDWDNPGERIHRAVNTGGGMYEELVVFFLDRPDAVPQPAVD